MSWMCYESILWGTLSVSDLIQLNKFAEFHDGKSFFFCKTDFLLNDFNAIREVPSRVVLVSGNSDYGITEELAESLPQNVTKWFCTNNLTDDPRLVSLPMGIENTLKCPRPNHGYCWAHAIEKEKYLSHFFEKYDYKREPEGLIYANFSLATNGPWRTKIRNICLESKIVKWQDRTTYTRFMGDVMSHRATLCPLGNAPHKTGDNHRVYETLYLNRVPIVFAENQKKLYQDIYRHLPVVILDDPEALCDEDYMNKEIDKVVDNSIETLKYPYWEKKVLEARLQ